MGIDATTKTDGLRLISTPHMVGKTPTPKVVLFLIGHVTFTPISCHTHTHTLSQGNVNSSHGVIE